MLEMRLMFLSAIVLYRNLAADMTMLELSVKVI